MKPKSAQSLTALLKQVQNMDAQGPVAVHMKKNALSKIEMAMISHGAHAKPDAQNDVYLTDMQNALQKLNKICNSSSFAKSSAEINGEKFAQDMRQLTTTVKNAENQSHKAHQAVQSIQENYNRLDNAVETLKQSVKAKDSSTVDVSKAIKKCNQLDDAVKTLKQSIEAKDSVDVSKAIEHYNTMNSAITHIATTVDDIDTKHKTMQKAVKDLHLSKKELKSGMIKSATAVHNLMSSQGTLSQDVCKVQNRLNKLETKLAQKDEEILDLRQKLGAMDQICGTLINKQNNEIETCKTKASQHGVVLQQIGKEVSKQRKKQHVKALVSSHNAQQAQLDAMQVQLMNHEVLTDEIRDMTTELATAMSTDQSTSFAKDYELQECNDEWQKIRDYATEVAQSIDDSNVTPAQCKHLLHTMIDNLRTVAGDDVEAQKQSLAEGKQIIDNAVLQYCGKVEACEQSSALAKDEINVATNNAADDVANNVADNAADNVADDAADGATDGANVAEVQLTDEQVLCALETELNDSDNTYVDENELNDLVSGDMSDADTY